MSSPFECKIGIENLQHFFKIAPKETKKGVAEMLNSLAFEYRRSVPSVLKEHGYKIRNASFVGSRVRVVKAKASDPIGKQVAIGGSVKSDRFTGWIEEITGDDPTRMRTIGAQARKGDMQNQAERQNRLLPSDSRITSDDFNEIPERVRVPAMLAILARNPSLLSASKGAFIIKGVGNWAPGLYRFKKGQAATMRTSKKLGPHVVDKRESKDQRAPEVVQVQKFGEDPRHARWDWNKITAVQVLTRVDQAALWRKCLMDTIRRAKTYKV